MSEKPTTARVATDHVGTRRVATDSAAADPAAAARGATDPVAAGRVAAIEQLLRGRLQPQQLQIIDDSRAHAGHRSAAGKGHFRVLVVSTRFAGLTAIQRHRLVNEALGELWYSDLHAVSVSALTPDEFRK